MKIIPILCSVATVSGLTLSAQTKFQPADTEFYEPKLRVVQVTPHAAPSDAIILFDGSNLSAWTSAGNTAQAPLWTVENGVLTVKPGSGDIITKQNFEDFQLHIEWKSPEVIKGEGQGRGNSGVLLQSKYEVQVLDNNNNPTYINGQAASLYKQYPPLVEVRADESGWHTYDIIFRAPRFNKDNLLVSKGTVTVIHNGVVVQNHSIIEGTTEYIGLPKMITHGPGPIQLQDHGDLVHYRNIWIREL